MRCIAKIQEKIHTYINHLSSSLECKTKHVRGRKKIRGAGNSCVERINKRRKPNLKNSSARIP
ncbi:hypothetical protein Sjap_004980 [Stephania japonica]|uniref:Uncharacterized protein n=1 Tax=Stephania japonica TaxID=461633 RepID=A0AAP0K385_9MAGN